MSEEERNVTLKSTLDRAPHSSDSNSSAFHLEMVSSRICQVMVPVALCCLYVITLIRIQEWNSTKSSIADSAWKSIGIYYANQDQFSDILLANLIIVSVFLLMIIAMTLLMLLIFYIGWHGCLSYYFYIPSLIILALISPQTFGNILSSFNVAFDYISLVLLTWNFTFLGMISIFNLGIGAPLYAQQFFLIHNSSLLAIVIINILPNWAPWFLLITLIMWDLFAVLAPFGPLNLIIGMAEKEGVIEMPGLIYSTDVPEETETEKKKSILQTNNTAAKLPADGGGQLENKEVPKDTTANLRVNTIESEDGLATKSSGHDKPPILDSPKATELHLSDTGSDGVKRRSIEEKGVNIGLGDFIFYGLMIGLTVKGRETQDFYATLASFVGLVVGLVLTLTILAVTRRALPALPISIALGILSAAGSSYFAADFSNELAYHQIFI